MARLKKPTGGVVIPFYAAKSGLWAAQREWIQTSKPLQGFSDEICEVLDRAERELEEIAAALHSPPST